jgi:hypothetical protein
VKVTVRATMRPQMKMTVLVYCCKSEMPAQYMHLPHMRCMRFLVKPFMYMCSMTRCSVIHMVFPMIVRSVMPCMVVNMMVSMVSVMPVNHFTSVLTFFSTSARRLSHVQ